MENITDLKVIFIVIYCFSFGMMLHYYEETTRKYNFSLGSHLIAVLLSTTPIINTIVLVIIWIRQIGED